MIMDKVLGKKGMKGNQGGGDDSATDNNGTIYKEVRLVKLNFSATNFKASVTGWHLAIDKKFDILFPAVCVSACTWHHWHCSCYKHCNGTNVPRPPNFILSQSSKQR